MSVLRFLHTTNRNVEADPYTTTHWHNLLGGSEPEYSFTDKPGVAVATPNYIYYRIYAEDGAILSSTPIVPGDPFIGRIKLSSVPPPRTAKAVKCSIAKVENIKERESTSLFLTPFSQSSMDDADKITILNGTGPGATPQEPLALVAYMSDSERSELESERRGEVAHAAEPDTKFPGIRYVYYQLYADDYEIPSKAAVDQEEPSLGRIRADSIAPPHSPISIKLCISRVEEKPGLVNAAIFENTTCDTPLEEGQISIFRTDGPGWSPNEPMALVQMKIPSIPDGRYLIKNRGRDIYWCTGYDPIRTVYYFHTTMEKAGKEAYMQWDITHDAYGDIFITSPYAPSLWVGDEIKMSAVPDPWRLIPADDESFYLTTEMNHDSQNPRVPTAQRANLYSPGGMATLKEGDQWQMWEFIRIYNY